MDNAPSIIKICGVQNQCIYNACLQYGVDYIGFVFYNGSNRYVDPFQSTLLSDLKDVSLRKIEHVGLFVNHDADDMARILDHVPIDIIQLHGTETPKEVMAIAARFQRPVIKAIGVNHEGDVESIAAYEGICDLLIIDAKPDHGFGGSGKIFEWSLMDHIKLKTPWLLAGGLTPQNIAQARAYFSAPAFKGTKPIGYDVSSGVEDENGLKSPAKIKAFVQAARGSISQ
jgi:phosphoribosylanthranilate isomerase